MKNKNLLITTIDNMIIEYDQSKTMHCQCRYYIGTWRIYKHQIGQPKKIKLLIQ